MFDIAIPVESQFIPLFQNTLPLYGDLSKKNNRKRLLNAIYDFLYIWTKIAARGREYDKEKEVSLLITKPYFNDIVESSTSYSQIVNAIFNKYAELKNKLYWGDKMAFRLPVAIENIADLFPSMKVVHIIRDGRDVALSWKKIWTGPKSISEAARLWKNQLIRYRLWGRNNPSRYIEIFYEDFVEEPGRIIDKIGAFVNMPVNMKLGIQPNNDFASIISNGNTHELLRESITITRKHAWRREMSNVDQKRFEGTAGVLLQNIGYQVCFNDVHGSKKIAIMMYDNILRIVESLTVVSMQMRLKYILPTLLAFYRFFARN